MNCMWGVVFHFRTKILMKNQYKTLPKPVQLQIPDLEAPGEKIDGLAAKLHHKRPPKLVWMNFDIHNGWV